MLGPFYYKSNKDERKRASARKCFSMSATGTIRIANSNEQNYLGESGRFQVRIRRGGRGFMDYRFAVTCLPPVSEDERCTQNEPSVHTQQLKTAVFIMPKLAPVPTKQQQQEHQQCHPTKIRQTTTTNQMKSYYKHENRLKHSQNNEKMTNNLNQPTLQFSDTIKI